MDSSENGDRRVFQQKNSIGMVMMSGNSLDPFTGSDWDPMYHIGNFGNSSMVPQKESDNNNPHYSLVELQSHIINSSGSVRYPCDQSIVDRLPIIPNFEIGNFPEMINSRSGSISQHNATPPRNAHSGENRQNSEDGLLGALHNGKRRKLVLQGTSSPKNTREERKEDAYEKTYESPEDKDEKKHNKSEGNGLCNEPSKEDYFHVRAKKGQATNSHSLAERLRRERISERMKLLQELVPGCNKITGKAVMLDEIINYVQSLQNQVEFLSMKLATANPELNMDIEPILSGDILHSQGNNATVHGNHLGWSSSHPYPGFSRGTFDGASSTTSAFLSLPHNSWKNSELQTGYNFDPSSSGLGPNGM